MADKQNQSRIRQLRLARGLTLVQLSERSGVAFRAISAIERGHRRGSVQTVRRLAAGLGVPVTEIADIVETSRVERLR